ncbi:MAG TPA: hypothetical protein VGF74_08400 [Thermoleophilaceae bacterium]
MALKSPAAAALVAACLIGAAAFPALAAGAPESPIPVHITYSGVGTFHMTNSAGGVSEATDNFTWTLEYSSTLNTDGSFTPATGTVDEWPGSYTFDEPDESVSCSGALPTNPPPAVPGEVPEPPSTTPLPQLQGLDIQSLTYLSPDQTDPAYAGCQGQEPGDGLPFDATGIASDHAAGLPDNFLPGVMTAHLVPLPLPQFLAEHALHVQTVSDAQAVDQLPESCAPEYGLDNPNDCQMSIHWSGTLIVDGTAACPLILVTSGGLMCLPPATTVNQFEQGFSENAPGAGSYGMSATAAGSHASAAAHHRKRKPVVIARAKAKARHAGSVRLKPRLTPAGKRALKRAKRLKVTVRVVFTPKHGKRHVTSRALTLKR